MRFKPAIALLVLLAGCGGAKDTVAGYDGAGVPWAPAPASQLAPRAPGSHPPRPPGPPRPGGATVAPPRRAADLAVQGDVTFAPYGNGGGIAVVALRNKGTGECRLQGSPRVRLVKDGGPQQVNNAIQRPPVIFPDTAYPPSTL